MLTRISELPLRLIGPDLMREPAQERKKGETHQRRCRVIDHLKRERAPAATYRLSIACYIGC